MKNISSSFRVLGMVVLLFFFSGIASAKGPKRVLVFSKTVKFRHKEGIAAGKLAILQLGKENKFEVDTTEDAAVFTPENLKKYAAVVFLSTTGDVLDDTQQAAFQQYIKSGGGFMGIHSATDTEYDWPWYGELVGAYFGSHPAQQEAVFNVVDQNHLSTRHLPKVWKRKDELYNFKWIAEGLHVLIKIDENSYTGGKNGENHPMCWYHDFGGGRAFYTELGHDNTSFEDPIYIKHILGGIQYAMGMKLDAVAKSR